MVGCFVKRVLGECCAVGDIDRRLVGIKPLVELTDQLGVPGLVGGVPVEDFSEDGNAGSVDTEAGFELPEIAAVVGAVAVRNLEGVVVLGLVDAVNREGCSISVKDVTGDVFGVSRPEQHGPEDRARLRVGKFVEGTCTRVIVDILWLDAVAEEVLDVGTLEKFGQPIHWLPFGEDVHYQRQQAVTR